MVRLILLALAVAAPAMAGTGSKITLDLNRLDQMDTACRLTFVATNDLADVTALTVETVLFDRDGRVAAMTLFDFGDLPDTATRVRQFDIADQRCDALAQVLVNGVATCAG
ncbi:MAG: hypothetical protein IIX61_07760, partial [Loktanella sp.]|nr:hypothetical protein [Loktanella sp.]